jgi:hypothetical protein
MLDGNVANFVCHRLGIRYCPMLEKEGGLELLERLGTHRRPHALSPAIQRLVHRTIERCRRFSTDLSYAASDEEDEAAELPVTCASSDEEEPAAQQPNAGLLLLDFISDDE